MGDPIEHHRAFPRRTRVVPGPGDQTAYQSYCGAEYERVFSFFVDLIERHTAIPSDLANTLARRIATGHADTVYQRLIDPPLA